MPRLGVGALTCRLLGHGRETQKRQECGADQSRDCGAGHKCSCRLNARSQRFVPVIPPRCLATVWAAVRDLAGFAAANDLVGAFANMPAIGGQARFVSWSDDRPLTEAAYSPSFLGWICSCCWTAGRASSATTRRRPARSAPALVRSCAHWYCGISRPC